VKKGNHGSITVSKAFAAHCRPRTCGVRELQASPQGNRFKKLGLILKPPACNKMQ